MSDAERLARVALCRLAEPGDLRMIGLVRDLGAEVVLEHLANERDLGGVLNDVAQRVRGLNPARDLEWADKVGARFVTPSDAEWPTQIDDLRHVEKLQQRGGEPLGLWVKGKARLSALAPAIAMVGSRSSTSYGGQVAQEIAATVAREGICVVSGAAVGIDADAHLGALAAGGVTAAVLACGVDRAYPVAHAGLLNYIAEEGAVISEAPPGTQPGRIRFLARNRLIAALGRGTVVVEAALRSGALNTSNWTERLGRALMAVPGPVTSAPSQGAHQLIRSGATLVTNGEEVLELVGRPGEHLMSEPRAAARPRDSLSSRDQQVLDAVPKTTAAGADSIARVAGINLLHVQSALDRLHRKGLIQPGEGGWLLTEEALV
jgi:DNA processing protein